MILWIKMIRKFFRKRASSKGKLDSFLDKYNLPRSYFNINRKMISRGVFIGLFWGFIPMPFQMVAVIAMTPLFRFNVPIAIAMVWLSNPFTMPFMYYMEYLTGNFILGREAISNVTMTVEWFFGHMDDIFIPLYVGTAFYSTIVSGLIAIAINWLWVHSVNSENSQRKHKRNKKNRFKIKK